MTEITRGVAQQMSTGTSTLGVPSFATIYPVARSVCAASATTSSTTVFSASIPGGALGANGYIRIRMLGGIENASGGSRKLEMGNVVGAPFFAAYSISSTAYPTGNIGSMVYEFFYKNTEGENIGVFLQTINLSHSNFQVDPAAGNVQSISLATTDDWVFSLYLKMSAADFVWYANSVFAEVVYAPDV